MFSIAAAKKIEPEPCPVVHNRGLLAIQWILSARLHTAGEPILEVTVYNSQAVAVFRTFTSRGGYFSQYLADGKWGTAKLFTYLHQFDNKTAYLPGRKTTEPFITERNRRTIRRFLQSIGEYRRQVGNTLEQLHKLHEKIARKSAGKAIERKEAAIAYRDIVLGNQPELPDSFYSYISQNAPYCKQYIFYRAGRGRRTGYCLNCKNEVDIPKDIRHRQKWICPSCGQTAHAVSEGVSRNYMRIQHRVGIVQMGNHKDEVYLREYYVAWDYTDIRNMRPRLMIMSVTHMNRATGKATVYRQRWASFWCGRRFIPPEEKMNTEWTRQTGPLAWTRKIPLYVAPDIPNGRFANILKDSGSFGDAGRKLMLYGRYPAVEYIRATGFHRLYQELSDKLGSGKMTLSECPLDLKARKLPDLFRLSMQDIRLLSPHNPGIAELAIYRAMKRYGGTINDGLLHLVFKIEQYQWRMADALAFASPQKIINYLNREYEKAPDDYGELCYTLQTWTDYLQDAVKLGYDLSNRGYLFPKDLLEFHRKTSRYVEHLSDPVKERKIGEIGERYGFLRYEDPGAGLLIRPASGASEIIKEGNALHHCVGGYVDRVLQGECLILVIRRSAEPQNPYYTLEYQPETGKIMQCHGMRHQKPDTEIQQFTDDWLMRVTMEPAAA